MDLETLSGCPRLPEEGGVRKVICWLPLFFYPGSARLKNEFLPVILAFSKNANGKSVHEFVGEDESCTTGCVKRVFHRGVESHRAPELLS
jgi:hypothetical protein